MCHQDMAAAMVAVEMLDSTSVEVAAAMMVGRTSNLHPDLPIDVTF